MSCVAINGTLVEAPRTPRRVWCGEGVSPSPPGAGSGEKTRPSPQKILLLFDLKMDRFGAVFKLDLTEETRTQLQEEEPVASSCLILATPM